MTAKEVDVEVPAPSARTVTVRVPAADGAVTLRVHWPPPPLRLTGPLPMLAATRSTVPDVRTPIVNCCPAHTGFGFAPALVMFGGGSGAVVVVVVVVAAVVVAAVVVVVVEVVIVVVVVVEGAVVVVVVVAVVVAVDAAGDVVGVAVGGAEVADPQREDRRRRALWFRVRVWPSPEAVMLKSSPEFSGMPRHPANGPTEPFHAAPERVSVLVDDAPFAARAVTSTDVTEAGAVTVSDSVVAPAGQRPAPVANTSGGFGDTERASRAGSAASPDSSPSPATVVVEASGSSSGHGSGRISVTVTERCAEVPYTSVADTVKRAVAESPGGDGNGPMVNEKSRPPRPSNERDTTDPPGRVPVAVIATMPPLASTSMVSCLGRDAQSAGPEPTMTALAGFVDTESSTCGGVRVVRSGRSPEAQGTGACTTMPSEVSAVTPSSVRAMTVTSSFRSLRLAATNGPTTTRHVPSSSTAKSSARVRPRFASSGIELVAVTLLDVVVGAAVVEVGEELVAAPSTGSSPSAGSKRARIPVTSSAAVPSRVASNTATAGSAGLHTSLRLVVDQISSALDSTVRVRSPSADRTTERTESPERGAVVVDDAELVDDLPPSTVVGVVDEVDAPSSDPGPHAVTSPAMRITPSLRRIDRSGGTARRTLRNNGAWSAGIIASSVTGDDRAPGESPIVR